MSICDGPFNNCTGDNNKVKYKVRDENIGSIQHSFNSNLSFNLGDTEIIVAKRNRDFTLSINNIDTVSGGFFVANMSGSLTLCSSSNTTSKNGSVSEQYSYTTTVLYFLDTRYNNAIGIETIENLTFNKNSVNTALFRTAWENVLYNKFLITNHIIQKTINMFIILRGVKTILHSEVTTTPVNTEDNPLILLFPNPSTNEMPLDADVLKYGFYDYHAVGEGEGESKIRKDGGDDYYFTDWMRNIGKANQICDQNLAEQRYFAYWLRTGGPTNESILNPGLLIDRTPIGSIAVDSIGNIFYSILLGGNYYNKLINNDLTEEDLTSLISQFNQNPRYYPVGII